MNLFLKFRKDGREGGACVVQSIEHPHLGFCSGPGLGALGWSPPATGSLLSGESIFFSLQPLLHTHTVCSEMTG